MNYLLVAPELILASFGIVVLLLDLFIKEKKLLTYWTLAGLLTTLLAVFYLLGSSGLIWNGILIIDSFSLFFKIVFLVVAILVTLASATYIQDGDLGEYFTLIIFSTLGMMFVASSGELITLFVSLELATVPTYALVGFFKKDPHSSEAAIKYFIIGALSSAIIVFGMSLIYGVTGSTYLYEISAALREPAVQGMYNPVLLLGTILLVAGFAFEIAAVPFHMWVPDTYQGAPTTITIFMAAQAEAMGFAAIFRLFGVALGPLQLNWQSLFMVLAVMTLLLGNLVPLVQTSVKRLLAYSCIGHAGYILIGLAVATPLGFTGGMFHVLTYAFMKGGAFLVVTMVSYTLLVDDIDDYAGLRDKAPLTAFCMLIFLLSLAGVPPLAGFWSKFIIFSAAIEGGVAWLAVLGVITSAISLYYYARIIKAMYLTPTEKMERIKEPKPLLLAMLIALAGTILIGLYPEPILKFVSSAVQSLLFY
ncbi:MAG: NADH-quinone oxidoreductase subunit N [Candidatus Hydrothermarchaeales archaeon]